MHAISGIRELANRYDAFILDLWGVIHDGLALYPGVADCLEELNQKGKRVLFLSNAPRRSAQAQTVLAKLGVHSGMYEAIITSGEVTYQMMAAHQSAIEMPGTRYLYMGLPRDAGLLRTLGYQEVRTPDDADFILNTGTDHFEQWPEEKRDVLREAQSLGLPMLCPNPDLIVVRQSGQKIPCAGALGVMYEELGGTVLYIGKPYPQVYHYCLERLKAVPTERVLAVGDNPETDILGANQAGIDCVLVTGGILPFELGLDADQLIGSKKLGKHCATLGAHPDYLTTGFRW